MAQCIPTNVENLSHACVGESKMSMRKCKWPSLTAFFATLVHDHPPFLSSVYSISYPSRLATGPYYQSLLTATSPPLRRPFSRSSEQSSSQENHVPEVIIYTGLIHISRNFELLLPHVATAQRSLLAILVGGHTYKNKLEGSCDVDDRRQVWS